jgi:hypothetical protein
MVSAKRPGIATHTYEGVSVKIGVLFQVLRQSSVIHPGGYQNKLIAEFGDAKEFKDIDVS